MIRRRVIKGIRSSDRSKRICDIELVLIIIFVL